MIPTYDLTSLLTTISSASASFIAILGGLVASKLLTISSERDAVLTKISELDKEISVKETQKSTLQKENNDSDALDFIESNIADLIQGKSLDLVFEKSTEKSLSIESLQPYWETAIAISKRIQHSMTPGIISVSQLRSLEKESELEYAQDAFSKNVSLIVLNYFEDQFNRSNSSPFSATLCVSNTFFRESIWDRQRYENNTRTIFQLQASLDSLHFQMSQYEKDMARTHTINSLIDTMMSQTTFIKLPESLIMKELETLQKNDPNITYDEAKHSLYKIFFIASFSLGLLSTFLYMKKLLNWSEFKKDSNDNKEV